MDNLNPNLLVILVFVGMYVVVGSILYILGLVDDNWEKIKELLEKHL